MKKINTWMIVAIVIVVAIVTSIITSSMITTSLTGDVIKVFQSYSKKAPEVYTKEEIDEKYFDLKDLIYNKKSFIDFFKSCEVKDFTAVSNVSSTYKTCEQKCKEVSKSCTLVLFDYKESGVWKHKTRFGYCNTPVSDRIPKFDISCLCCK